MRINLGQKKTEDGAALGDTLGVKDGEVLGVALGVMLGLEDGTVLGKSLGLCCRLKTKKDLKFEVRDDLDKK